MNNSIYSWCFFIGTFFLLIFIVYIWQQSLYEDLQESKKKYVLFDYEKEKDGDHTNTHGNGNGIEVKTIKVKCLLNK